MADGLDIVRAGILGAVPHGFLGRGGGTSHGDAAGLNAGLGAGDDPGDVAENRRRAAQAVLPGAPLVGLYQIHSAIAVAVKEPWPDDARPRADAVVTDRPGLLLGIVTADCAPVLLADAGAGVIGAAHAGWRGAHGGVLEATVAAMEALGADRGHIAAAIGPAIAQRSYEVDAPFRDRFHEDDGRFFAPGRQGRWMFDLEGYAASRLRRCGVDAIEPLGLDTYGDETRFYSYRRATHRGEAGYGRQISLIGLPG